MIRAAALATAFATLVVGGSEAPRPSPVAPSSGAASAGPSDLLPPSAGRLSPDRFPTEEEAASGCDSATAAAIGELEQAGAIVEPTYEETRVRRLQCLWAEDDRDIAVCRFEKASIPGLEEESVKRSHVARLREKDWEPAGARFALVRGETPYDRAGAPRWVATDTCLPFVFKSGELHFDLREMARQLRREQEAAQRAPKPDGR